MTCSGETRVCSDLRRDFHSCARRAFSIFCRPSSKRSSSAAMLPSISTCKPGRSRKPFTSVSSLLVAVSSRLLSPAANCWKLNSSPLPPKTALNAAKGLVTIFVIMLRMVSRITFPSLNLGSSRLPSTGTSSEMRPFRSFNTAMARRTGSRVASGLPVFSPSVSWSMTIRFAPFTSRPVIW